MTFYQTYLLYKVSANFSIVKTDINTFFLCKILLLYAQTFSSYALSAFIINFEQHSLHRALARCLLEPLGQLGFEAVDDYFGFYA